MARESVNRAIRTVMQGHLIPAFMVLLRAFGVPITNEQIVAAETFVLALGGVVLAWNQVEELTGRSVLKGRGGEN